MNNYNYKVKRVGRDVIYQIYRGDDLVDEREVPPIELGFLWIITIGLSSNLETIIEKCFIKAHKLADKAVKVMEKLEKE